LDILNINDCIIVDIDGINQYGSGFGEYKDYIIEVPKSNPGEKVKVEIKKINEKDKIITASLIEIIRESKNRINRCNINNCLFCKSPNLLYEEKIAIKKRFIESIYNLEFIGFKVDYKFKNFITLYSRVINNNVKLGFLDKNRDLFVETIDCPLYTDNIRDILVKNIDIINNSLNLEAKKSIYKISLYYSEYEKTSLLVIELYKNSDISFFKDLKLEVTSFYIKSGPLFFINYDKFIIEKIDELDLKYRIDPYNKIEERELNSKILTTLNSIFKKIVPQKSLVIHANNGLTTLLAARCSKIVYSVEKSLSLVRDILFNLKLNKVENVIVLKQKIESIIEKNTEIIKDIDTIILHSINSDDIESIAKIANNENVRNIIIVTHLEYLKNYIEVLSKSGFIFNKNNSYAIDRDPNNYYIETVLSFKRENNFKLKIRIKK